MLKIAEGERVARPATDEFAVAVAATPRTWPTRRTDYRVTVVNRSGETLAVCLTGTRGSASRLANEAWTNLRAGVAPALVWNV